MTLLQLLREWGAATVRVDGQQVRVISGGRSAAFRLEDLHFATGGSVTIVHGAEVAGPVAGKIAPVTH